MKAIVAAVLLGISSFAISLSSGLLGIIFTSYFTYLTDILAGTVIIKLLYREGLGKSLTVGMLWWGVNLVFGLVFAGLLIGYLLI